MMGCAGREGARASSVASLDLLPLSREKESRVVPEAPQGASVAARNARSERLALISKPESLAE